jgi:hypothetical protein
MRAWVERRGVARPSRKQSTLLALVEKHVGEPVRRLHVLTATRSIYIEAPEVGRPADDEGPEVQFGEPGFAKAHRRARR